MPKQPSIPGLRDAIKKKVMRCEQFLAEMDAVVPWSRLFALIAPDYPKAGPKGGRPSMPLETMLRVYFLQNWYALSDQMAYKTLYDNEAMRRFARIDLGDDCIPDETDPELPPLTGAARADRSDFRRREQASGRQGNHVAVRDFGPCNNHRRTVLDEEQGEVARPRDVVQEEGQRLVFRYEGTCRCRCRQWQSALLEASTAKLHNSQAWDELLHGEQASV